MNVWVVSYHDPDGDAVQARADAPVSAVFGRKPHALLWLIDSIMTQYAGDEGGALTPEVQQGEPHEPAIVYDPNDGTTYWVTPFPVQ